MSATDRVRGLLAAAGHAWTRPRAAVFHALASASSPVTAEEIHSRLAAEPGGERVNLSSVYRTVNLLRRLRVVRTLRMLDGARRFELAGSDRHDHSLLCEVCGRTEVVRGCPLDGTAFGAGVRAHRLELYGLCRRCAGGHGTPRDLESEGPRVHVEDVSCSTGFPVAVMTRDGGSRRG